MNLSKELHRLLNDLGFAVPPQPPFTFVIATDDQHVWIIHGVHPWD